MNLLSTCPNGCKSSLCPSNIIVAEGELNECLSCGQLVSSCSKSYYERSNQKWNSEEGTWPSQKDYVRLMKRRTADIQNIAHLRLRRKYRHHSNWRLLFRHTPKSLSSLAGLAGLSSLPLEFGCTCDV